MTETKNKPRSEGRMRDAAVCLGNVQHQRNELILGVGEHVHPSLPNSTL